MNGILERFASSYAAAQESLTGKGDDQSSIHYPAVLLFIGDKTADAIGPIMKIHRQKWDNSAGVTYFHVGTASGNDRGGAVSEETHGTLASMASRGSHANERFEAKGYGFGEVHSENGGSLLSRFLLDDSAVPGDPKTIRKELHRAFYRNEKQLFELNKAIRRLESHIAGYGRMYSSFDRIHLSVITRVDDPLNVFIPEISLLAQSIFSQSFKSVQMDLYALISEREQLESFGYASSAGMAFLRELDMMQRPEYTFSAPLHVTEDGLSIPVRHPASPLFDLVYVLSDKNERGIADPGGMQDNYEIICHLGLLKNRKQKEHQVDGQAGSYNNTSFKNNIMTESGRQGYVSAGFSRVKRPNQPIALTVLYHFYSQLLLRMKTGRELGIKERLAFFGLDPAAVSSRADHVVPDGSRIEEMNGMMTRPVGFASLKGMSVREAEEALFGDGCRRYFQANYEQEANEALGRLDGAEELDSVIRQRMAEHPEISVFHIAAWTGEKDGAGGVLEALRARIRDMAGQLEADRAELDRYYGEQVGNLPFPKRPLMDKHNVRSFIRYFLETIYQRKLELLLLETELKLYRRYEAELERLHGHYKRQAQRLEQLEGELHASAQQSIRAADDYIGQNIMEYYGLVTEDIVRDLEARRGPFIFFEDRYVGNLSALAAAGTDRLLERLIAVVERDLLTAEPFDQTFEDELLRRANVTIDYSNKQVLSKEDLFKMLYRTLEEHAVINVRLFDYTQEHRYEEKYFFGDASSEFVRYALGADETSRIYKLGVVHEKRSSGVEKLNLMGGFHLEDLMYYRNGKAYYETYVQNGYEFHGVDPGQLPELR
ncbi:transcription initiation factor TFIID [Paenibacillus cellulositrophicus]|uniref:transcription initiation factor TFIID n=1 Tax=Paenibacillus cellulositrophicus TaxID=562959 RepID=UPI00126752FA|nr:transcription initiation factor TFIID [Paenibacillus cellulositrophicus]